MAEPEIRPKAQFESYAGSKSGRFTKAIGKNAKGEFAVVEPQRANYTTREMRDEKIRTLKEAGITGICKFTTHEGNDPRIIYVVTWSEPLVADSACKTDAAVIQ
jgi:hypothetical protein